MDLEQLRLIIFISLLIILSTFEFFFSYRKRVLKLSHRLPGNLGLILISSLMIKLLVPFSLISISLLAQNKSFGLFNFFEMNNGFKVISSLIILDFFIYLQHVLSHKINFLWRFHRVHHSDLDLDATSALRFHPIEIVLSLLYKSIIVILLGIDPTSILIFEIILNSMAMFNHSNIYLPKKIESILRLLIVTPQMHIIHHSIHQHESDTNYGFNLSIWDRLFRTYTNVFQSEGVIGQKQYSKENQSLTELIVQPWK